ncbi:hypothetical protein PENTCL1PPCAC_30706, partial [Pristionchus entomophagus]
FSSYSSSQYFLPHLTDLPLVSRELEHCIESPFSLLSDGMMSEKEKNRDCKIEEDRRRNAPSIFSQMDDE